MTQKRYHREQYPLDTLKEFGLTEDMIYDLPNFVHETLEMGGKSPLLPLTIQQPFGYTRLYAKFCLVDTERGVDVLFCPKLKEIDLSNFSDAERRLLMDGKVIVADVQEAVKSEDGTMQTHKVKSFVQIDTDTNSVVYTPTAIIGANLHAINGEFNLSAEELESFWTGELVTVAIENSAGEPEPATIGIDLFSEKGVVIVPGDAENWHQAVRKPMPEYSFGNEGCWVNKGGVLTYVPEEEFTDDINEALRQQAMAFAEKHFTPKVSRLSPQELDEEQAKIHAIEEDNISQLTR